MVGRFVEVLYVVGVLIIKYKYHFYVHLHVV
jgi:hypothetical protein